MNSQFIIRRCSVFVTLIVSLITLFPCHNPIWAQDKLEIQIDSDNSGSIENSPEEQSLANCPYSFGKLVEYNPTDQNYVEFHVVVPASPREEKRILEIDFDAEDVMLWEKDKDGKMQCVFAPLAKKDTTKQTKQSTSQTDKTSFSLPNLPSWNILNINIDGYAKSPLKDADLPKQTANGTRVSYSMIIDGSSHVYTFYFTAWTPSENSTWIQSKSNIRPTRKLTVTLQNYKVEDSIVPVPKEMSSCQYIIVDKNSIYKSIFDNELLSQAIAAWAVYHTDSDGWTGRYGLTEIDKATLHQWGFTDAELAEILSSDEGFRVCFYRDWIHNKYYVAFKGTDIRTSFLGDMTNNALLCTGKFSPYLKKALFIGAIIHERFPEEIRNNCVIVGHSLGGALASGAGITSQGPTTVFNGLGLTYSTLNETSRLFLGDDTKTNQYICSRIEECFPETPNSPIRKYDSSKTNLRYFNTKYDLLNVVASEINGLDTRDDILPSALGVPCFQHDTSHQSDEDAVDQVRNLAKQIDEAIQAHQDDPVQFKKVFDKLLENSLPKDGFSLTEWSNWIGVAQSKAPLFEQIPFALKQHSLETVIEEILAQCHRQSSFSLIQTPVQSQIADNNSDANLSYQKQTTACNEIPENDTTSTLEFFDFLASYFQGLDDYLHRRAEEEQKQREHVVTVSTEMIYVTNMATIILFLGIYFGENPARRRNDNFCLDYDPDFTSQTKNFWLLRLLTFSGRCGKMTYCTARDALYLLSGFIMYVYIPVLANQSINFTGRTIYYTIAVLYVTTLCSLYSLRLHDNNKSAFHLLPVLIFCNLVFNGASLLCINLPSCFIVLIAVPWILLFIIESVTRNPKRFGEYALSSLLNAPENAEDNRYGSPTDKAKRGNINRSDEITPWEMEI